MSKCSLSELYERQWLRFSTLAHFENKHPVRSKRWWERVRLGEDSVCWITSKPGHGFVMDPLDVGLRLVGQVVPDKHTIVRDTSEYRYGWYDNNYGEHCPKTGDGLIWGEVYLLVGRNHMTRFVAGWRAGACDGVTIDFGSIFEDDGATADYPANELPAARRAAKHADGMAEDIAEDERIYRAQQEEEDA